MLLIIIVFGIVLVFLIFLKKDDNKSGFALSKSEVKSFLKKDTKEPYYPEEYSSSRSRSRSPDLYHYKPHTVIPPNPLLEYQYAYTQGRQPVMLEDPINPPAIAGPLSGPYGYGSYLNGTGPNSNELGPRSNDFGPRLDDLGPYPGKPLNVPVPQGSLKMTSEKWKYPFYASSRPLEPYDYFKPYGPNQKEMQTSLGGGYADDPYYTKFFNSRGSFPNQNLPFRDNSGLYNLDYTGTGGVPFIGSVNAYAPFAEINTQWEKSGILTRIAEESKNNEILNLYVQPIAPINDIFKYMVQDKDGFMIPLKETFLENGDVVDHIPGKSGKWLVHVYINDKYIWV